MNQKQRKDAVSDWLTVAMGKLTVAVVCVVLFVGLPIYGLWWLTGNAAYEVLRWVTVALIFGFVVAFFVGFYFGKVEVRGFLGGIDAAMDKLAKAVNLRDNSRIAIHEATHSKPAEKPQPNFNVYLPQPGALPTVPVSHRQLVDGEVIDL